MSPVDGWIRQLWHQAPSMSRIAFGLDLGARTTRVWSNDRLTLVEPSCFVWHRGNHRPFAFGRQALQYMGKTPQEYEVVWPFVTGRVEDQEALEVFLQLVMQSVRATAGEKKKTGGARWSLPLPALASWPVASAMSPLQRAAIQRLCSHLNCTCRLAEKAAAYQRVFQQDHGMLTVVDCGAQSMEVVVSLDNQVLLARTLDFGSDLLTTLLQQQVRQHHHLEIGWSTAEMIKAEVVTMPESTQLRHFAVRGRDIQRGVPATVTVVSQDFHEAVHHFTQAVLAQWQAIWMQLDPEVLAKMGESGLWLAGNGGRLRGFAQTLEKNLQLEVRQSPFPGEEVVRGAWQT